MDNKEPEVKKEGSGILVEVKVGDTMMMMTPEDAKKYHAEKGDHDDKA